MSNEAVITKEALDELRKSVEQQQDIYHEVLSEKRSIQAQLKDVAIEIGKYGVALEHVIDMLQKIKEKGLELQRVVKEMEASLQRSEKLKQIDETLSMTLKQTTEKYEQHRDLYDREMTSYTTIEATFKEQLRNIDEDYHDLAKLTAQIAYLDKAKVQMAQIWEDIQSRLREDQAMFTKAEVTSENMVKQHAVIHKKLVELEEQFKYALMKASFLSEKEYTEAKMSETEQEKYQEQITAYKQTVVFLEKELKELEAELKDEHPIKIVELEAHLQELKLAYEQAFEQVNQTKKNITGAHDMIDKLHASSERKRQAEEKLAVVTDLYKTIRGDNPKKISFERYLQIDYLDQIMIAANERFRQLSDGQFYLKRSERLESHGRPSGLGIDVYDALTGQVRDVKTLSGGEKFVASLCLALGMSDVIQSFQGNISIETMFIDEGFGTLDEAFLNKAIDVLIELQNTGRTIGVISHREELKAIFPAMLAVEKTKDGYSKTKFTFK